MSALYLYQTVHVLDGRPRLVEAHAALLDEASRTLFGRPYAADPARLARRIAAVAAAERYPAGVSGFVRLELTADGDERLHPAGVSLYRGYALRSLTPRAASCCYDTPFSEAPTSVREAAARLAAYEVRRSGADIAVHCTAGGVCLTADDGPLFAVRGHAVLTAPAAVVRDAASPAFPSVERELALRAVRAAGLTAHEECFTAAELKHFDELFYADHRGLTSLSSCDGHPFMSLVAERIAAAAEGFFTARS